MTKTILVTGAGGVLGSNLVNALAENYHIFAVDLKKEYMTSRILSHQNVSYYLTDEIFQDRLLQEIDLIIHCAFSRSQKGNDLAKSIQYSEKLYRYAIMTHIPKIINISSQSLYGTWREKASEETDDLDPFDMYAVAKYACERIAGALSENTQTQITNIRLASLIAPQFPERIVYKMIVNAQEKSIINIVGGQQIFSFLDLRDAVYGLKTMIDHSEQSWDYIYNLASNEHCSIIEMAEQIRKFIEQKNNKKIDILIEAKDVPYQIRLNGNKFMNKFHWKPQYKLYDTIAHIYGTLYD